MIPNLCQGQRNLKGS